jgi:hypothetical protein
MEIVSLWGLRKGNEDGLPELMVAWDEDCFDSWSPGFERACQDEREAWGDDLVADRIIRISVPEEDILKSFAIPKIYGEVTG